MHQVYPTFTACFGSLAGWRCKNTLPRIACILWRLVCGTPDLMIDFQTWDSPSVSNSVFFVFLSAISFYTFKNDSGFSHSPFSHLKLLVLSTNIWPSLASPILNNTVIESLINNRPVISSSNPQFYDYLFSPPINSIKNKYEFYEELEKFITSTTQLNLSLEKINIWREKMINLPHNYFKLSID